MNKKKLLLYISGFLIIIIILLLLAPAFIDLNRFKPRILEEVKKATGRSAKLDSIKLSIIPWLGARLTGIELSNAEGFSQTPQIKLDSVLVKIRFFPLIFKKIKIKEINIVSPEVLVEKKGEQYNFYDLTGKKEEKVEEKEPKKEEAPSQFLREFTLSQFKLTNGRIRYQELDNRGGVLNSISLDELNLRVENLSNTETAKLNFSTIINQQKEQSITLTGTVGPGWAEDFKKAKIDLSLLITKLNLQQFGTVLKNKSLQGILNVNLFVKGNISREIESGGEISLAEFIKELNDKLTLNEEISINFEKESINIKGIKIGTSIPVLEIAGRVENFKKNPELDITLSSPSVDLKKIFEYNLVKKSLPPDISFDGSMKINGKISGTKDNMAVKATIDMSGAGLKYGDIFTKTAGKTLNLSADLVSRGKIVSINSLILNLLDVMLKLSGQYNTEKQDVEIHLASSEISLKSLSPLIPPAAIKNPAGTVQLNADMRGNLREKDKLNVTGSLVLKNIEGEISGIAKKLENVEGKINFTRNSLELQSLKAKAGETSLKIDMRILDFEKPKVNFSVYIPRLNLDEIMPPSHETKKEELKKEEKPADYSALKKYTVKGRLNIDSALVRKIDIKNLQAELNLENNKLQLNNITMNTFNGTISGNTSFDVTTPEPAIAGELHLKNLDVNSALSTLSSYKDTIYGALTSDISVTASGDSAEKIKSTMNGSGTLVLKDGKINTFSALNHLVNISNLSSDKFKKSSETKFKEIKTGVKIEKGRVFTKDMTLTSEDFNAKMEGSFGLDATLDYKGEAVLSKEASDKALPPSQGGRYGLSEIGGVLKDENGRIVVPFILGGTLKSPKFSLDMAQAKERAKKTVQKKVQEEINKEIKKTLESEKTKELENKGKEKLKGIFKK